MRKATYTIFLWSLVATANCSENRTVAKRALQRSHEKSQLEKWEVKFLPNEQYDQTGSLVNLLNVVALRYLTGCTTIILYDVFTENSGDLVLERLLRSYPIPYVHGQITEEYLLKVSNVTNSTDTCVHYMLFLKDVMRSKGIIGPQSTNKVVVVARSSQWRVYEYLASEESQSFINLLVIARSEKVVTNNDEAPYILYTHKLYTDALGSSVYQVLTSWMDGKITRPHVSLFPKKIVEGFAGHRFIISLAHQPPFVIRRGRDDNDDVQWDGIEVRLVRLLAKMFNFTTDFREAKNAAELGSAEAVTGVVQSKKANMGIAGLYVTSERIAVTDSSTQHSQDCAAFISLTSTALPKYRAIMGPFQWTVWMTLTIIYLVAILPLAFSDKHTLRHLIEKPQEVENMFWYVFGTFTNSFSFRGKNSWSNTDKVATRLLIGFYWLFTIIITACYTGSIIAFVTIPVFPATVDTPQQLLSGRFQIGTLDKDGWQYWFLNSTDEVTSRLFKKVDLVPDVTSGLRNTTKAFFWPYAFLGSSTQLNYIVRTNFSTQSKRSLLHISSHCFVPFGVGLIYNKNSVYRQIIDAGILKMVQSGVVSKLKSDVEWQMLRSATGKLLAANSYGTALRSLSVDDRALTVDDTQGMFLLLAIGFVLGGASLVSEWFGGCFHLCKRKRPSSSESIASNIRSHDVPTPREKLDSIQYQSFQNHVPTSIAEDDRSEEDEKKNVHNCIVHASVNVQGNCTSSSTLEEEIDRLFNFESFFGDENRQATSEDKEEIADNRNYQ